RLPDETEIRVIHYYVQIRQVMLCSDGQLFDHELEIVVARKCHDSLIRFGAGYTQCCWTCPPQRSGLAGIDPGTRTICVQHLRSGNLTQPDRGHIRGIATKGTVHFLVYALRFDRFVIEVRFALELCLACSASI